MSRPSTPCFNEPCARAVTFTFSAIDPTGIIYLGVTNDLIRRVYEHREGAVKGFSKTHNFKHLVYYEQYDDIRLAIQRERTMKHWPRAWKVRLINGFNREWDDLYPSLTS